MTARPWEDPELVARGRAPMHALAHAAALSLDGTWRFQLLERPDEEPGDDWRDMPVPSAWTMQDTFDRPHYTNVQMPFPGEPPRVPDANPTGVYERTFEMPDGWAGRRTVLHVGAAESLLIVHLNGREVGISKDSHLAAEFDVTTHLRPGSNTLRLTVVKWSDATYIEDQDQWWHGGITRSVYIYTTGRVYLVDVSAHTGKAAAAGRRDALGSEEILGLQRSIGNAGVSSMLEEERSPVHDVISSGGRPLEPEVRTDMEARMGHDFSDVRVHDD